MDANAEAVQEERRMKTWDAVYQEWQTDDGQIHAMRMGLLIRCKDCKYFERLSIYHHGLCDVHCNGVGEKEVTSEDQYCSWAERKEE